MFRGTPLSLLLSLAFLISSVPPQATSASTEEPVPAQDVENGNQELLADPIRPLLYWAEPDLGIVHFANATTGAILASIPVGMRPLSMDLSADGSLLYVAIQDETKIVAIDVVARSVARTIPLAFSPLSVQASPRDRLYVSGNGDATLRILNETTGAEVSSLLLGMSWAVLDANPQGTVLIAVSARDALAHAKYAIDSDPPLLLSAGTAGGVNLQQVAVHWSWDRMYAASQSPSAIEVISLLGATPVYLPMEAAPKAVAISPDGRMIIGLVSNPSGAAIWMFDTFGLTLQRKLTLTRDAYLLAASSDGVNLFVGPPLERVALPPTLAPWTPERDRPICYSPGEVRARVLPGFPDSSFDSPLLALDGTPLPTSVVADPDYVLLSAPVTSILAGGLHTIHAELRWNGQTVSGSWTFPVDYVADSPTCPEVGARSPGPGWILDASPNVIEAYVWYGDPTIPGLEDWSISLDGAPLDAGFVDPGVLQARVGALPDGTYEVTAEISWRGSSRSRTWNFTVDADLSIPRVPLDPFTSAAGFRIPVPRGWTISENVAVGDIGFDLVATGEDIDGIRSALAVATEQDSSVREDEGFLRSVVDEVIADIQADDPSVTVSDGPTFRTLGGHSAVVFVLRYGSRPLFQKVAVVASDPHDRFWIVVLTAHNSTLQRYSALFEHIVAGFEITLAAPWGGPFSVPLLALAIGGSTATLLALALVIRSRSKRAVSRGLASPASCPRCGEENPEGSTVCAGCGHQLPATLPEQP